jgi:hypothetical protein
LYICTSEEGWHGKSSGSGAISLLSYTLRYVSLTDLGRLCQVGLRLPPPSGGSGIVTVCLGKLNPLPIVLYYESIKREPKRRLIYEYRCDERLKTKTEESTRLGDTGLVVELEHLKIETRLIDEKFASVRGECEI